MTETQIELCKTCLNRKIGYFEPNSICNIRDHVLSPEANCNYFDLDKTVVSNKEQATEMIRPNDQRAKWAIILLAIILVLDIISLTSSYLQLNLLKQLKEGVFVSDAKISANDTREQIIGIFYIIAFVISGVVFIQWFRRAYYNLQLRTGNCEHSDAWAAGAWFVPILSLFRPYNIMVELWEKTTDLINEKSNANLSRSKFLIGLWWFLWIVSNYIGKYILKNAFNNKTIEDYINQTSVSIFDSAFSIPLAIVTIMMVRAYSKREAMLI